MSIRTSVYPAAPDCGFGCVVSGLQSRLPISLVRFHCIHLSKGCHAVGGRSDRVERDFVCACCLVWLTLFYFLLALLWWSFLWHESVR